VAALIVLKQNATQELIGDGNETSSSSDYKPWGALHVRRALADRLAAYKLPQEVKVMTGHIPRNAMGKGMFSYRPYLPSLEIDTNSNCSQQEGACQGGFWSRGLIVCHVR
jgi:hypothetical protein